MPGGAPDGLDDIDPEVKLFGLGIIGTMVSAYILTESSIGMIERAVGWTLAGGGLISGVIVILIMATVDRDA